MINTNGLNFGLQPRRRSCGVWRDGNPTWNCRCSSMDLEKESHQVRRGTDICWPRKMRRAGRTIREHDLPDDARSAPSLRRSMNGHCPPCCDWA